MVKQSPTKERVGDIATASGSETPPVLADRVGIERAFDVIRHHTVHTKGYVLTALKLIEEFGNAEDKALLADLLRKNGASAELATSQPPVTRKKVTRKK